MISDNSLKKTSDYESLSRRLITLRNYYRPYRIPGDEGGHEILRLSDGMLLWVLGLLSGVPVSPPADVSEWVSLIRIAHKHDFLGFLYHQIFTAPPEQQPPEQISREMRRLYHQYSVRHLWYEKQICSISDAFRQSGIRHLLVKGLAIGYLVYPGPALRPFRDIDLYIHHDDYSRALDILSHLGYRVSFDGHAISADLYHHQVFLPPPGLSYISVELHWRLLNVSISHIRVSYDELYRSSVLIPTSWGDVRTFRVEEAFLYASLHTCVQHAGEIRLIWISDLVLLMNKISQQNRWHDVHTRVELWNAGAAVHRAFDLVSLWFGPEMLSLVPKLDSGDLGIEHLTKVDRICTGDKHKIWSQIRKMPTIFGKIQVVFHYIAATRAVHMVYASPSIREYWGIWFSILIITIRRWLRSRRQ